MLREIERLMRCVDSFDFFKEIAAMQGLPRAEPVDAVVQAVVEALGVE